MKIFGDYTKALARMQPGVITQGGFLGEDTRSLMDIIQQDEEAFSTLGLDWEAVAARLQQLQEAARQALGEPATVEGQWLVQSYEARGRLPCPFGDRLPGKTTTTVTLCAGEDQPCPQRLIFSELSLHLLSAHHFLQGRQSPFRLEPVLIKQVLGEF